MISRATVKGRDSEALAVLLAEAEAVLWAGQPQEAIALLDGAAEMDVTEVERYTIGTTLLRASNCQLGWHLYDLHPSRPVDRLAAVERWDGERCKLLIILAEQGFGDMLQFLRFVPAVADQAENIVVAVHDELFDLVSCSPLLRDFMIIGKSAARAATWPPYTRYERLLSLPARVSSPRLDRAAAFLRLPDRGISRRLPPARPGIVTIGVAWRATYRRGCPNRSFPARLVRELVRPGRTRVVTIHRTSDVRFAPPGVEVVQINNFTETAEVISQCDYIVTADTVTAHLGPGLGVPTLICFLYRADWRWGVPANPTNWYASAEMLFQAATEDWRPVLAAAGRTVTERVEA